ncbi:hypothetical protein GGI07_004887 [Coemansia sp. Benny D115]|nr:hypothetical protein GGI07_004887 [Coemansia sp. Benny D115]
MSAEAMAAAEHWGSSHRKRNSILDKKQVVNKDRPRLNDLFEPYRPAYPKTRSASSSAARAGRREKGQVGGLFGSDGSDSHEDGIGGIDSDDPANTAMFLDEKEEMELVGVVPGTPMALKKLGMMTVKSIERQRASNTPRKAAPVVDRDKRFVQWERDRVHNVPSYPDDSLSPTRKGRSRGLTMEMSIKDLGTRQERKLVQTRASEPTNLSGEEERSSTPVVVRRLKSARRASEILDKIRAHESMPGSEFGAASGKLDQNRAAEFGRARGKGGIVPAGFQNGRRQSADNGTGARLLDSRADGNPLTLSGDYFGKELDDLLASGPPSPSELAAQRVSQRQQRLSNISGEDRGPNNKATGREENNTIVTPQRTPVKQIGTSVSVLGDVSLATPMSEHRHRLETLRSYFGKRKPQPLFEQEQHLAPSEPFETMQHTPRRKPHLDNMLISFENIEQQPQPQRSGVFVPSSGQISQLSPIYPDKEQSGIMLQSPSPSPKPSSGILSPVAAGSDILPLAQTTPPTSDRLDGLKRQGSFDFKRMQSSPVGQDATPTCRSDLIDLSSRLNMSIDALNTGLRGHAMLGNDGEDRPEQMDLTKAAEAAKAAKQVSVELTRSIAGLEATAGDQHGIAGVVEEKPTPADLSTDEAKLGLDWQVNALRDTMVETKNIVSAIRSELDQQKQGTGLLLTEAKLDDIMRLLGALDMRLQMLESRRHRDTAASENLCDQQPVSSGSTKVHGGAKAGERGGVQEQGVLGIVGRFIGDCLNRYPYIVIGVLVIVLVSELLVIGGIGPMRGMQTMGQFAANGLARQMALTMQRPS